MESVPTGCTERKTEIEALFHRAVQLGQERHWKYLELRGVPAAWLGAKPSLTFWGHTLDLRLEGQQIFNSFNGSTRRAIRKAESAGLTIRIGESLEDMRVYYALHCRTRQRHGLPPQPWRFFANLQRHLLAAGHGFVVTACHDARPVASAVFLHSQRFLKMGGAGDSPAPVGDPPTGTPESSAVERPTSPARTVDAVPFGESPDGTGGSPVLPKNYFPNTLPGRTAFYKYGAADLRYQEFRGSNLVIWRGILACRERGAGLLHFGRTSRANEGLRSFKLGFGTRETVIDYLRFDLRRMTFVQASDRAQGPLNQLFRFVPQWAARGLGAALYRHTT